MNYRVFKLDLNRVSVTPVSEYLCSEEAYSLTEKLNSSKEEKVFYTFGSFESMLNLLIWTQTGKWNTKEGKLL